MTARMSDKLIKTWEKLKSGLNGWTVRHRTVYRCEDTSISTVRTIQPGPSVVFRADYSGRGLVSKLGSNLLMPRTVDCYLVTTTIYTVVARLLTVIS